MASENMNVKKSEIIIQKLFSLQSRKSVFCVLIKFIEKCLTQSIHHKSQFCNWGQANTILWIMLSLKKLHRSSSCASATLKKPRHQSLPRLMLLCLSLQSPKTSFILLGAESICCFLKVTRAEGGHTNSTHLLCDPSSSLQIIQFSSQSNYNPKLLQQRLSSTKWGKRSRRESHSLTPLHQSCASRPGAPLPTSLLSLYLTIMGIRWQIFHFL